MWTRQEVKHKGKGAFFKAYWKFVLVALVLGIATGAGASSASSGLSSSMSNMVSTFGNTANWKEDIDDIDIDTDEILEDFNDDLADLNEDLNDELDDIEEDLKDINPELGDVDLNLNIESLPDIHIDENSVTVDGKTYEITDSDRAKAGAAIAVAAVAVAVIFGIIYLIAMAVTILLDVFVKNPIEYGCQKFLRKSQDENTSLSTMFAGFKDGYKNIIKVMFFRDLFVGLWTLLFIIPGIVKSYEYRMVPFLLSENPGMTKDEALKASSRMMYGQKWRTFVLDLSFIGWHLLSLLTLGMLGIFYVSPYKRSTDAALYETLKAESQETVVAEG